ncbi:ClbS/DfsB family four-helix bundle protein [Shimia marina]|uniref:DinB superfamily protein n=1 Tax=Shimia marina TaxID=321267 RepID=A0A0P1EPX2_9RHOB|nr:ClbS/DfsB family four-helix bundle protein [Shimia marina]CUH52421.1 hypothetical protein SHM7688_01867 [Shimia marina]SFE11294.1 hypothetical protein SAMN04488037_105190 [Shimia marina]
MPAATTKEDLLAIADKEFSTLLKVIATVPAGAAQAVVDDNWSICDVLVHRAHWIDLFLGWYADGQAGKIVAFPAPGYKWNQLRTYNDHVLSENAEVGWAEAKLRFVMAHQRWHALVDRLDQDELYGAPMKGGNNNWSTGRWAEAAASSHYRSAAKFIRACLRQMDQAAQLPETAQRHRG